MFGYIYYAMIKSAESMYVNQHDLSEFTNQTDHHEPNFSFHLTNELWKYFPWLSCDFDVRKTNHNRRPDLIFHRRGRTAFNLLVVEVKRKRNPDVRRWICRSDELKIHNFWFQEPLNYPFGISIVLDEQNSQFAFSLFQKEQRFQRFFSPKEHLDNPEIAEIIAEMIEAKKQNPNADTKELESKIDCLVYQLYDLIDEEIRVVKEL